MRTDKEIMQIIDEAIKSIWENEIQSDYNANWIMNEDGLKNALYFHLRKQLEPILRRAIFVFLRSSKTQSFKENSIGLIW